MPHRTAWSWGYTGEAPEPIKGPGSAESGVAVTVYFSRLTLAIPVEFGNPTNVGSSIGNQWLEVTVLAGPNTGTDQNDVFYVGNQIGESGNTPTRISLDVVIPAPGTPRSTVTESLNLLTEKQVEKLRQIHYSRAGLEALREDVVSATLAKICVFVSGFFAAAAAFAMFYHPP